MPFDGQIAAYPGISGAPFKRRPASRAAASRGGAAISPALVRAFMSMTAALSDAGAIIVAAVGSGTLYHKLFYVTEGMLESHIALAAVVIALFVSAGVLRGEYEVANFLSIKDQMRRTFTLWNAAYFSVAVLAFMTKSSADISRGTFILVYFTGLAAVSISRAALCRIAAARASWVATRRIFLVGREADMLRFTGHYNPEKHGMRVISAAVLRSEDSLEDDLALAAASARMLRPDDVFILAPWSQTALIDAAVKAFLTVPAALHLGPERVLDRFGKASLDRMGPIASLNLTRQPLGLIDIMLKRAMDIAGACAALILLSPVLAVVAALIKLDSPGPVFFKQRRYGFNQEPFRIFKFRSMTTMEDGRDVVQARAGDARVTRIGRFIRRCNIDELPQLLNVLRGDMSLVGPRPHAMAHDQMFERDIALYARRHNVKPGITGWAQVNGFRGETSAPGAMRGRVEHDLYYIDNWSLGLDIKTMFLKVFSGKAYRNAC